MEKKDLKVVDCEAIEKEQDETECAVKMAFEAMDKTIKDVVEQGIVLENAFFVEPDTIGQFIEDRLSYWGKLRKEWNPENILELIENKKKELEEMINE